MQRILHRLLHLHWVTQYKSESSWTTSPKWFFNYATHTQRDRERVWLSLSNTCAVSFFFIFIFASKLLFNTNLARLVSVSSFWLSLPLLLLLPTSYLCPALLLPFFFSLLSSSCPALASVCFTLSRQQLDKICLCLLTLAVMLRYFVVVSPSSSSFSSSTSCHASSCCCHTVTATWHCGKQA